MLFNCMISKENHYNSGLCMIRDFTMCDSVCDLSKERAVLQQEYEWILAEEVGAVVKDVQELIMEIAKNFKSDPYSENGSQTKSEKFMLTNANAAQQIKCVMTLLGDLVYEADLALKLQKQQLAPHQTKIYPEAPWKLQQIQDAGNHLQLVLSLIDERAERSNGKKSAKEVINFVNSIIEGVKRARDSIMMPKRRTLEELMKNPALKLFRPALPADTTVSFYVQANKIILSVYYVGPNQSNKVDIIARYQVEATVPWLNNALTLMTICLQNCQQLKDKLVMFQQYEDELNDFVEESKTKSNNPFLDSPDEEMNSLSDKQMSNAAHELFNSDSGSQNTWM